MNSVTSPRGSLPARVYWTRRGVMVVVVLALVWGMAHLFGGNGGQDAPQAATSAMKSRHPHPSPAPTPSHPATTAPSMPSMTATVAPAPTASGTPAPGAPSGGAALAAPDGQCAAKDLTVTPLVAAAEAAKPVSIRLRFTGTRPACTFAVSPQSVAVRISSGSDRVWSSQDCANVIPRSSVTVRSGMGTIVPVTWSGRRSGDGCGNDQEWARPGYYHATAAVLGSTPSDAQFQLSLAPRPVITRAAKPTPSPTPTAAH